MKKLIAFLIIVILILSSFKPSESTATVTATVVPLYEEMEVVIVEE